jgi:hypothetical protein
MAQSLSKRDALIVFGKKLKIVVFENLIKIFKRIQGIKMHSRGFGIPNGRPWKFLI